VVGSPIPTFTRPEASHVAGAAGALCYVRDVDKVTPDLASRIEEADEDGLLDVIVELDAPDPQAPPEQSDRRAAMEAVKLGFLAAAEPVEKTIISAGGEVTGAAWINRTLRARIPARSIARLSEESTVTAVDVPRAVEPESS
jgi:hypothetical protein